MARRFSLDSGLTDDTRSEFYRIISNLQEKGLDDQTADDLRNSIEGPNIVPVIRSELVSLQKLSEIHGLNGYEHEYDPGTGSTIDHVFHSDRVAYEVKRVTWRTNEIKTINRHVRILINAYRKLGTHTQVIYGPDRVDVFRDTFDVRYATDFTEVLYAPPELMNAVADKAAKKAKEKASEVRGYLGHQLVVLDLTGLYCRVDAVKRRIRRLARSGKGALGEIDGVLLLLSDYPATGVEVGYGLEPILFDGTALTPQMFDPVRPENPGIHQGIYTQVITVDAEMVGETLYRQADGKLIFQDGTSIQPLETRWALEATTAEHDVSLEYIYGY